MKTILRLGINENMYKQKKKLDERIKEEAKELALLRNTYTDLRKKYLPEVRNTMEKFLKVENAIFTKEKQLEEWKATRKELTESWKHNKNVKIVITGRLYAGVVVQIDNVIWTAKEIQNVTLKKVDDRIAVFTNR